MAKTTAQLLAGVVVFYQIMWIVNGQGSSGYRFRPISSSSQSQRASNTSTAFDFDSLFAAIFGGVNSDTSTPVRTRSRVEPADPNARVQTNVKVIAASESSHLGTAPVSSRVVSAPRVGQSDTLTAGAGLSYNPYRLATRDPPVVDRGWFTRATMPPSLVPGVFTHRPADPAPTSQPVPVRTVKPALRRGDFVLSKPEDYPDLQIRLHFRPSPEEFRPSPPGRVCTGNGTKFDCTAIIAPSESPTQRFTSPTTAARPQPRTCLCGCDPNPPDTGSCSILQDTIKPFEAFNAEGVRKTVVQVPEIGIVQEFNINECRHSICSLGGSCAQRHCWKPLLVWDGGDLYIDYFSYAACCLCQGNELELLMNRFGRPNEVGAGGGGFETQSTRGGASPVRVRTFVVQQPKPNSIPIEKAPDYCDGK